MNTKTHKKRSYSPSSSATTYVLMIAIPTVLVTSGCGSTSKRRNAIADILETQNSLLRKVEIERRAPNVLRRIRRDETLWRAEVHLRQAIDAIQESNVTLTSALQD